MSTASQAVTTIWRNTANPGRWMYGPLGGAALAVGLDFGYAAVFIAYATIRASLLAIRVNPDAGVPGTVISYFFTLVIPSVVIAGMMAIPAAVIGLITAPILGYAVSRLNPQHSERRAIVVGTASCFVIAVILFLAFHQMLGFASGDISANPETFIFWFALPAIVFVAAGAFASRQLNFEQARFA